MKIKQDWFSELGWLWAMIGFALVVWFINAFPIVALCIAILGVVILFIGEILESIIE